MSGFVEDAADPLVPRRVWRPREGSANRWKLELDLAWLGALDLGEKGGEIEMGDRTSMGGLVRLARRGSLMTGVDSSSELMFSIPPETP